MDNITLTKEEILTVLRQQKGTLQERFRIRAIGIFGSFARNEATDQSDIDFIVDFEEGDLDYYTLRRTLQDYLGNKFNRNIDIAVQKSIKSFYKDIILNQAIYA